MFSQAYVVDIRHRCTYLWESLHALQSKGEELALRFGKSQVLGRHNDNSRLGDSD